MKVQDLLDLIGSDFYTGVPDSQLKALCNCLMERYGIDRKHHVIGANEGSCLALAAGYHLATGKVPVIYMQNSGEGNIINPLASLVNDKVYKIPAVFVIGWRGEPGIHDEPQHVYQGEVTVKLMEDMDVGTFVIGPDTTLDEVKKVWESFSKLLGSGRQCAFIIRKGALEFEGKTDYANSYELNREEVISHIADRAGASPIVSTTGKISRELYEYREHKGMSHETDFLTVGSMGHASQIALGIAINKPDKKVWCIDGDGAVLMHMGSLALIGTNKPSNLIHVVINNSAHETVGGMPTVAGSIDIPGIAMSCGYPHAVSVSCLEDLDRELALANSQDELSLIEVKCSLGSRSDLGRPKEAPADNKEAFMKYLST